MPGSMKTLADWLAHAERLHPKNIELGLDRVRTVAQTPRPGLRLPGDHRRRHQRQGLDLRHARVDPLATRATGRRSSRRRTWCISRSGCDCRARRSKATSWLTHFEAVERRARRHHADLFRIHHAGHPALHGEASKPDVADPRGRPRRPARCGQHHRRRLRRHHQHRPRPHGLPGPDRETHRLRKSRHPARRPAGHRERPGAAAKRDRPRAGHRRRPVAGWAATSTCRATSSSGAGAAAAGATAAWPIRRCAAPTSWSTRPACWPRWRRCGRSCRSRRRRCASGWRWSSCRRASRSCPASRRWCWTWRTTRMRWRR